MQTEKFVAIFWICTLATICFYLWLEHDKEMNGPCRDCSECVELSQWQFPAR